MAQPSPKPEQAQSARDAAAPEPPKQGFAAALALSSILILIPAAYLLGRYLDGCFDSAPTLQLVFILGAALFSVLEFYRVLRKACRLR